MRKPIKWWKRSNSMLMEENQLVPLPRLSLTNAQLTTAMSHPTRARVLTILNDRVASPKEIASEIEESLNNVAYHVEVLTKLGCIELVREESVNGGRVVQHFYRATERSYLDEDAWAELGDKEKQVVNTTIMRMMSYDVNEAMARGTLYDPEDGHMSRTPLVVDMEGWQEIKDVLCEALNRLLNIRENVNARSEQQEVETFPVRVNIIQFRYPSPKS
jgi:DNA-binding transcriptional ArsR family regulator